MKIDATNISRKHARINITREGDVKLTCIHKSCIFVKQQNLDDSWRDLLEGKTVSLEHGDEFKFLTDKFHFQILCPSSSKKKSMNENTAEKFSKDVLECVKEETEFLKLTGIGYWL